jgi:hypothetical protein
MPLRLVRKAVSQLVADLLGTPPSVQQLLHHCVQLDIAGQLPRAWSEAPAQSAPVCGKRPIGTGRRIGVAAKFAADGGRIAAELARDHPCRPAQTMQIGDADAFILGQEPCRHRGRRHADRPVVVLAALVAETTPVSPVLTGRTVNPDPSARLGIR